MRIVRAAMQASIPWKNGGGTTREIARVPADASLDAFDWRVSRAHVADGGPFSRFEDVDRTLLVLTGAGIRLAVEGLGEVTLNRVSEPYTFAGDIAVDAKLVAGPIDDLNVMTRRGRARHHVVRRKIDGAESLRVERSYVVLVVENGELDVEGTTLVAEDALVAEAGELLTLRSAAQADVIIIDVETTT